MARNSREDNSQTGSTLLGVWFGWPHFWRREQPVYLVGFVCAFSNLLHHGFPTRPPDALASMYMCTVEGLMRESEREKRERG